MPWDAKWSPVTRGTDHHEPVPRRPRAGVWPRMGEYIMVRDSDAEAWLRRMSAGGGYYFHDEYGTEIWPIKQHKEAI